MKEIFERLQCSFTQAKLYQLLLENGPSIASLLAKRAKMKRATVYGALEGLERQQLIETYKRNNVRYYRAVDPEFIINLLDRQFEEEQRFNKRAHKMVKELKEKQKSQQQIIEVKNVVSYYEGHEAVAELIQENLSLPHKIQYCIGLSGYHSLTMEGQWKNYISTRVNKGMKVKSIQADTSQGKEYQQRDQDELRETRLIPPQKCPKQGELNIIGDHIILYTSEEKEALGVKIVNKKIAQIMKSLFQLAWEKADQYDKKD